MTNTPKPVVVVFPSNRAKKRLGLQHVHDLKRCGSRTTWKRPYGKLARKEHDNRSRLNHLKSSDKIREVIAPTKVGKYEIVLLMKRYYDGNARSQDSKIIEVLKDIIPGDFKITSKKLNRYSYSDVMSTIERIYLKSESDLFAVQLAIGDRIWRIKRIVGRKENDCSFSKS